jgi:CheY-like chemotaxis protein
VVSNLRGAFKERKTTMKILIMDDENRDIHQAIWLAVLKRKMETTVVTAKDGDEAIRLFRKELANGEPFDFSIFDLTIPGGRGGQSAAEEILNFNPDAKIVAMSGYSDDPRIINYQEYGFCGKLHKPYRVAEAIELLNDMFKENKLDFQQNTISNVKSPTQMTIDDDGITIKKSIFLILSRLNALVAQGNIIQKNTVEKSDQEKFNEIVRSLRYCLLASGVCNSFFFNIKPELIPLNLGHSVENILGILSVNQQNISVRTSFDLQFKKDLVYDKILFEQILFILFKNAYDYLQGTTGSIMVFSREPEKMRPSHICQLEIRYQMDIPRRSIYEARKVLIVDDDQTILHLLKEVFIIESYDVSLAVNGFECLDLLNDKVFDVVVLDMKMDGMAGAEVLKTLRLNPRNKNVPVVIYSGDPEIKSSTFKETISGFAPVEYLVKDQPPTTVVRLCNRLTLLPRLPDSLAHAYSLNPEKSERNDYILGIGFQVIRKILGKLGGEVVFGKTMENGGLIVLNMPDVTAEKNINEIMSESIYSHFSMKYLEQLYENLRHDLKNKLGSIQYELEKLPHSSGLADMLSDFKNGIHEARKLIHAIQFQETEISLRT